LRELVELRASLINGCAYCIDMHTKDARRWEKRATPVCFGCLERDAVPHRTRMGRAGLN
jgi:AhpD family alkylhydroperoxidase